MKLVINSCYGGFGVSHAAIKEMLGKCKHVKACDPVKWFGGKDRWEEELAKAQEGGDAAWCGYYFDERNWVVDDQHRDSDVRSCPILVATVEHLKQAASSSMAKLTVVEVPDDLKYELDDYDGIETVHELHRSWS